MLTKKNLVLLLITAVIAAPVWAQDTAAASSSDGDEPRTVVASFSDYYATEMNVSADKLWSDMKEMYVEAQKFARQGYEVSKIEDDPIAYLGGTRVVKEMENGALDDRRAIFTAIDDEERYLALQASYNVGLKAFASYIVRPISRNKSEFQLVVHADIPLVFQPGEEITRESVAAKMAPIAKQHKADVREIWAEERQRIERKDQ